jgi:hypothetical protein
MRSFLISLFTLTIIPLFLTAQEKTAGNDTVSPPVAKAERTNFIKSGFYLKLGPVIPTGKYGEGQVISFNNPNVPLIKTMSYLPAELGGSLDIGYLIYLGPAFANKRLRAGIDFAFLNIWMNSTSPPNQNNLIEKYYSFVGQKIGPIFTINPVDKFMIDLSYKINANLGYHDELDGYAPLQDSQTSEYGVSIFFQEVSLGFRYKLAALSFQYNWGSMDYNNAEKKNPSQKIDVSTFRVMIGLQF